jgi:hypothetical protein
MKLRTIRVNFSYRVEVCDWVGTDDSVKEILMTEVYGSIEFIYTKTKKEYYSHKTRILILDQATI